LTELRYAVCDAIADDKDAHELCAEDRRNELIAARRSLANARDIFERHLDDDEEYLDFLEQCDDMERGIELAIADPPASVFADVEQVAADLAEDAKRRAAREAEDTIQ
jgi:hypothetical protein